jgi:hypothetical protein
MQKKIAEKIKRKQIESEFNVEIIPRRPCRKGWIRKTYRDSEGNPIGKDGHVILTQVKTDSGKTLTPAEQFQLSAFGPKGKMLRELRKQRQEGSEVGLDRKFEEDLGNV